jgi:diamine N-acetyltransferase
MVRLEKVNNRNVWKLLKLRVHDDQKNFVATNTESIVEAYTTLAAGGNAFPFGIYDEENPVGFLMIGYGVDDDWENPPEIAKNNYYIWRLMIDKDYQGKGYGKKAIELAFDFIRTWPCGKAEYCYLSYEPDNTHAKALYESYGFRENGDKIGDELIAVRKL